MQSRHVGYFGDWTGDKSMNKGLLGNSKGLRRVVTSPGQCTFRRRKRGAHCPHMQAKVLDGVAVFRIPWRYKRKLAIAG
jgi:hypothetical protein